MSFVVGRKYKRKDGNMYECIKDGNMYECIFVQEDGRPVFRYLSFGTWDVFIYTGHDLDGFKEYKEPVVHKWDVVWFKTPRDTDGVLFTWTTVGRPLQGDKTELKRETVTYTEEE